LQVGRTLAADKISVVIFFDPSRDAAVATNFVGKIDFQSTPCDIRQGGASGIRQEGKLLRRAQANKLPDSMTQSNQLSNNLTIINRQLEG